MSKIKVLPAMLYAYKQAITIAAKLARLLTINATRVTTVGIRGWTQPRFMIASNVVPAVRSTAPTNAMTGRKVMPRATKGMLEISVITTAVNGTLKPDEVERNRPVIPAMISVAKAAKWKWTTVNRIIVSPKPNG